MLTSRVIRNLGLQAMGIRPMASYHFRVLLGDQLFLEWVPEEDDGEPVQCQADVIAISEHGHFTDVAVSDARVPVWVRLYRAGPTLTGVTECRVLQRRNPPLPPDPNRI